MINQDGIDLDMCRDVTISDSLLRTGDDCIVVRAMTRLHAKAMPCENITVSNCVLDSACQGIRVGCPGDGKIRRCTFSNLVITGDGNGIVFNNPRRYLSAGRQATADVRQIVFSNVVIDCRGIPILMDVEEGIALPYLGDVTFSAFRIRSGRPITIQGNAQTRIRNVAFSDVSIETPGEHAIVCAYATGIRMNHVELSCGAAADQDSAA